MRKFVFAAAMLLGAIALIAADLTGTWSANVMLDAGSGTATFTLKQTGDALSGSYSGTLGEAKVTGTVKGDQVEWSFTNDQVGKVSYTGKVEGGKINGSVDYA